MSSELNLKEFYGFDVSEVLRNPNLATLYEYGILYDGATISLSGALVLFFGEKIGRSPKDKWIVDEVESVDDIWWGDINMKLPASSYEKNCEIALSYFGSCERIYIIDGFVGWDPNYCLKEELDAFGEPDYVIFNVGEQAASPDVSGVGSDICVALSFARKEFVILGMQYAGEMKKGIFIVMYYLMPKCGVFFMHCFLQCGR